MQICKTKTKENTGPSYEDRENKIMMINITMKMSFPSMFMMTSYSYQTSKKKRKLVFPALTFFTQGQTNQLICTVYHLTGFYMI